MSGSIDESTSGLPSAAPQSAAPQFFHRPDLHARPEDGDDVQPRRRKVRKGTHTCWECKRRKVRCTFSAPGDATFQVCARRCLRCVSQEFPEETTPAELQSRLVGDRLVQVEEMVRHLARHGMRTPQAEPLSSSSSSTPPALVPNSMPTPANSTTPASSVCCESLSSLPLETRDASASIFASTPTILTILPGASHEELAGALLAAFPSGPDLDLIASCTAEAYNHCQVLFRSQRDIRDSGFWPTTGLRARPMQLSESPLPHPVIIARQMLLLAVVLQLSDSRARKGLGGLSEPASTIAARLGSTAIGLVTRNDELLDTLDNSVDSSPDGLEGLECIILEAMYRGNSGQLRRSWLTWRRGISLAQLMRLPSMASRPASASSSPFIVAYVVVVDIS
ncbi:c6 zinc finger domain containing protein [Grosmannia clavigera kw1407]|uniref:C6 zinc finger domain containing protein n=1 Tax=Grosmannia clavigera (strain kw1407 / UAMH 11150) TaxID=655863 RepID=F0X7R3_GROCL|nr:c6 zinc finger domain containing protein [Grosmannia clavigera kw1407]EFX06466.1 c6 zinc finger domain containing protein [Grosmannia clavigera kw1407]